VRDAKYFTMTNAIALLGRGDLLTDANEEQWALLGFAFERQGWALDLVRMLGDAARRRMRSWTPSHNINALAQTVELARKLKENPNQMKL
jgi:hypothetical protein